MDPNKNIAQTSEPVVKISFGDPKAINEGDTKINQQAATQFKKEKDISKVSPKARKAFGIRIEFCDNTKKVSIVGVLSCNRKFMQIARGL
jgi:hypothetical protein